MIMTSATTGIKWDITTGKHLIGRGSHCGFVVDYSAVSREHAELEVSADGRIILTDKGSRNGTFVNDRQLLVPVELRAGDLIRFGNIEFQLLDDRPDVSEPFGSIDHSTLVPMPMNSLLSVIEKKATFAPKAFMAISDLGKMLIVPGSEEEMLEKALTLLQDIIKFGHAAIYLADDQSRLTLISRRTSDNSQKSFQISQTVIGEVLERKNAVLIQDASANSKYANQNSIIAGKIHSAMAVPLLYEDKVIGIIYIDVSYPGISYTETSLQVVAIFANILASKMTNHNFLLKLKEKEALEAEMAIASQIQHGLLPKNIPDIDGFQINAFQAQCQLVGGDLYDISLLRDGRIIFIIADVSGKGMGAALLASNILASLRILYNTDSFDLLEAITLTSDQLFHHSRPGDFATLFAGVLDPRTNLFQFVNAGHNFPLVIRADNNIEYLESTGVPIGVLSQHLWKVGSVELRPGDFIFAYTDGIPEATNNDGEQFGEERLIKFLKQYKGAALTDFAEILNGEVKRFLAASTQDCDDVTMIVIGRKC